MGKSFNFHACYPHQRLIWYNMAAKLDKTKVCTSNLMALSDFTTWNCLPVIMMYVVSRHCHLFHCLHLDEWSLRYHLLQLAPISQLPSLAVYQTMYGSISASRVDNSIVKIKISFLSNCEKLPLIAVVIEQYKMWIYNIDIYQHKYSCKHNQVTSDYWDYKRMGCSSKNTLN